MKKNLLIEKISERAEEIHNEVNQRYDDKPYSYLLFMVRDIMLKYVEYYKPSDDLLYTLVFASVFHDSIEDARLTYNDVKKEALKFLDPDNALLATEIVYALTQEKGRNRKERCNSKYYEGIRNTPYAPFIKLCDRMANMKNSKETGNKIFETYKKELDLFLEEIAPDKSVLPNMIGDLKALCL